MDVMSVLKHITHNDVKTHNNEVLHKFRLPIYTLYINIELGTQKIDEKRPSSIEILN